jgi:hypothetical protein
VKVYEPVIAWPSADTTRHSTTYAPGVSGVSGAVQDRGSPETRFA